MKSVWSIAIALILLCFAGGRRADAGAVAVVDVGFTQPVYMATLGEPISMEIHIEYGPGVPMNLFSYGVLAIADSTIIGNPSIVTVNSVTVPSELDNKWPDSLNAEIDDSIELPIPDDMAPQPDGAIGAKGTIDGFADPLMYYTGSLLTTLNLTFNEAGTYQFTTDFYNTLGPTEDIFIADESGATIMLDPIIQFGSTQVTVIPEPSGAGLVLLGGLVWVWTRRRR